MLSKKAIGPVVAVALLMVVAVGAVTGFQNWFQSYQSNLNTKVEQEASGGSMNTMIDALIGSNLYFKNGYSNLTINDIKVGNIDCNISKNLNIGMNEINLMTCKSSKSTILTGAKDVVLVTNRGIFTKTFLLDNLLLCENNWILVPGNPTLGTSDFCVMKYEAKATTASEPNLYSVANMFCGNGTDGGADNCLTDGSVNVTSKAASKPLTQVYQPEAKQLCANLGTNYHLISNAQWTTIARNAENNPVNWNTGIVGSGYMYSGHNDASPNYPLDASTNDSEGYFGETNTGGNQKRTLSLSNGNLIWDLAGNIYEWNENQIYISNCGGTSAWREWDTTILAEQDLAGPYHTTYNSSNGVGKLKDCFYTGNTVLRGGDWYEGTTAGAFNSGISGTSSISNYDIGFRCTYSP